MSEDQSRLVSQLETLGSSLSGVAEKLSRIDQEFTEAKVQLGPQLQAVQNFLAENAELLLGPSPTAGPELVQINEAIQKLALAEDQEQILEIFLEEVESLVDRAILFLEKDGSYSPWKSLGFPSVSIETVEASSDDDPIVRSARQQRILYRAERLGEAFPWLSQAGDLPKAAVCIPLVFGSAVPIVFYGDAGRGIPLDSLELLSHITTLVLKNHYLQTLLEEASAEPAPVAAQAPEAEPSFAVEATDPLTAAGPGVAAPVTSAPGEEAEPESPFPPPVEVTDSETAAAETEAPAVETEEPAGWETAPTPSEPIPEPPQPPSFERPADEPPAFDAPSEPEAAPEAPASETPAEAGDVFSVEEAPAEPPPAPGTPPQKEGTPFTESPAPVEHLSPLEMGTPEERAEEIPPIPEAPGWETGEPSPTESAGLTAEPAGPETTHPPAESQFSWETPPAPDTEEIVTEPPPVEEEAPGEPAPETQPPQEVEATEPAAAPEEKAAPPEEESEETAARHNEARRFARLLVSEIMLYNEEAVEQGQRENNLYQRLKADIDRSRAMYDKRVSDQVRTSTDHFHEELVRVLAGGVAERLGPEYPGPATG